MAYCRLIGDAPPKRHTQHRRPDGDLYCEELTGEEGFPSDSSLRYHRYLPSAIVDTTPWELPELSTEPNHPLRLYCHCNVDSDEVMFYCGGEGGNACEDPGYASTWAGRGPA